jgi:hypothetical protein
LISRSQKLDYALVSSLERDPVLYLEAWNAAFGTGPALIRSCPLVDKNADPSVQTAAEAYSTALETLTQRQEKSVEEGVLSAHVITLPDANHYVFLSNEADVLREMRAFIARLH